MRANRIVVLSILTMAVPAAADDDFHLAYIGFGYVSQSSSYEASTLKASFKDWHIGFNTYGIAGPIYFRGSHGFYNSMGSDGTFKVTDKATGTVTMSRKAEAANDQFLVFLPELEGGMVFGGGVIHPTLGVYFGDSNQYLTTGASESETLFYAIDLGLVAGIALAGGSEEVGFVLHPTLRVNASFYDHQTGFFDGGGGAFELNAAVKFMRKAAIYIHTGVDGHGLNGTKWYGGDSAAAEKIHASTFFFQIGGGYDF